MDGVGELVLLAVILRDPPPLDEPAPTPPALDVVAVQTSGSEDRDDPKRCIAWILLLTPEDRRNAYALPEPERRTDERFLALSDLARYLFPSEPFAHLHARPRFTRRRDKRKRSIPPPRRSSPEG